MTDPEVFVPEAVETVNHNGVPLELPLSQARVYMRVKRSIQYADPPESEMKDLDALMAMGVVSMPRAGVFEISRGPSRRRGPVPP